VAVLWLLSLLANAFLIPGERPGPEMLRWARPTREGITAGLAQGARLAVLTAIASWAAATTRTLELASSLEWSVRRVPGLRRRAHRALLPVVLSLRLLPLLLDEARRLLDVDRLRRGPRRGWSGARRVAGLGPVWVLLVVERAEALALALTLRGYRPDRERASRHWGRSTGRGPERRHAPRSPRLMGGGTLNRYDGAGSGGRCTIGEPFR
jgi:energy-coupling factor transport system permease protein